MSKNKEFEVNGVKYKMTVPNQAINNVMSGSPNSSLVRSKPGGMNSRPASSHNSASASSPKPVGPWMNQSSPTDVRQKFVPPYWSSSMRTL